MGAGGHDVAVRKEPAHGARTSTAHLRTGISVVGSWPGFRRLLGNARTIKPGCLGLVAAASATLAGAWVALSGGPPLLAMAPVVAVLGTLVIMSNRQAAAYVMLASLPFAEISAGHGVSLVRYVLVGALAAWFVGVSVFDSFAWLRPDRTDVTVLLWVAGSVASAVVFNTQDAAGLTQTYLNLALVYYMASRMVRNARQARGAVLALTLGIAVVALLTLAIPGLAGSVTASSGVVRQGPLGVSGAAGINRFAGWLAVGATLPWVALDDPRRPGTLFARGVSLASLLALVATVSKGGLIALGVGLLCWVVLSPRGGRVLRASGMVATLAAGWLLLPAGVHERFSAFLQPNSDAYSRLAIWDAGLRMFLAHPVVGVGVGNYDHFAPAYFPQGTPYVEAQAAHNIMIGALAETGIVGTLLLLMMVGTILLEGIRLAWADRRVPRTADGSDSGTIAVTSGYARLTAGLVVGYVVFLAVSLSADLERDRFFVVLAGLVHGLYRVRASVRA